MPDLKTFLTGRTSKPTPVDADELAIIDTEAASITKKLTWANLKAALKTYFDSLTTTLTNKTIDLTDNTLTGTLAEFNTAVSDANLASLTGTETLSGKTLTEPKIVDAGFIADANGNEQIVFQTTASAVNEIEVTNAATGSGPIIAATGGDTNIDLNLVPKGSGTVKVGGAATGVLGLLDTDASHYLNIKPGSNLTANRDLTITTGDAARTVTISGDTTIPIASQVLTFAGPTAARTITFPDAAITVARTDDANTFTGTQTFSSAPVLTGMTTGSIFFSNSGTVAQDNTNLFWDDTNNRLGIGTASPQVALHLSGGDMRISRDGASANLTYSVYSSTQAFHAPTFGSNRGRGTAASPSIVASGDTLFLINIDGQDTASTSQTAARISATVDGTPGTNDMPGRIDFGTTADGAASPTTRMTIKNSGSVIIGNSSSALATSATNGFLYVPSCAGIPSGTPTSVTGVIPIVVDSTNNKLYFYSGGAWRDAGP